MASSKASVVKKAPPGGALQVAVTTTSNVLYSIYRSYLSGTVGYFVPQHTREAAFQLFCDLRANTPKDAKFVQRHLRAFVPRTGPGWLALCSSLAYTLTGLLGLLCITLGLSVVGIYSGLVLAAVGGVALSFMLSALALTLFVTACFSGMFAAGTLLGYASLSLSLACIRFFFGLLTGHPSPSHLPSPQQQQQAASDNGVSLALPSKSPPAPAALPLPHVPTPSPQPAASASRRGEGEGAAPAVHAVLTASPAATEHGKAAAASSQSTQETHRENPLGTEIATEASKAVGLRGLFEEGLMGGGAAGAGTGIGGKEGGREGRTEVGPVGLRGTTGAGSLTSHASGPGTRGGGGGGEEGAAEAESGTAGLGKQDSATELSYGDMDASALLGSSEKQSRGRGGGGGALNPLPVEEVDESALIKAVGAPMGEGLAL